MRWCARSRPALCSSIALILLPLLTLLSSVPPAIATSASAQTRSDSSLAADALGGLRWRSIGPAIMGGRTVDIAGIPGDPSTVYMATASGGLFKTNNNGTTWRSVFESGGTLSLGAVAVAPSDPNVVYIGTGENNPRNSASIGNGVYRSDDAGETWRHLGLENTEKTGRIRVHPTDPDTVYVAALGHEWGANEERGVYRSRDGGASWDRVLFVNADTGAADLAMDPGNPRILYAGMYDFRRQPWSFRSGGPGSGLYRSSDGGDSWTRLTDDALGNGLPTGVLGRIGVAVAPSDASVVYAIIEAERGVMWRSDDRGRSWRMVTEDKTVHSRPFYFSDIRVDPQNENRVYLLEGRLQVTEDAGATWRPTAQTVHGDHQSLWIDPQDPRRLINGNDGGWAFSYDRGATWEFVNSIPIGQFYQISADMRDPYDVCGGLQDNHVWCGPSNSLTTLGILNGHWERIHPGGDGYYVQADPDNPDLVYTNSHYGNIVTFDRSNGHTRAIHPYPVNLRGAAAGEHPFRFNWNSPIQMSPHDSQTIYFGSNVLFGTRDGGQSWAELSPDLSTNDPEKIQTSGGPITPDNTSAEYHSTIITIAESPLTPGVIWTGIDDGNVQITRDGGSSWTNVAGNITGLPQAAWISRVEASHHQPGTAYISVDQHRLDDRTPYVFKTADYGRTWTSIAGDLPPKHYVHVVREDPRNPELLYVGTELGIFASFSGGGEWTSLRRNLPPVAVRDMLIHPRDNDLIIGTHGRSAWILDDLTPLQDLTDAMAADAWLFEPPLATRWVIWNKDHSGYPGQRWLGDQTFYGEDPPYGASISYYLSAEQAARLAVPEPASSASPATGGDGESYSAGIPKAEIKIAIRDLDGNTVRTFSGPAEPGINRAVWDLRHDPLPAPEGTAAIGFGEAGAPLALAGTYSVGLELDGTGRRSASFEVRIDPRVEVSDADLLELHNAVTRLTQMEGRAMDALQTIELLSERLATVGERLTDNNNLATEAAALAEPLADLRGRIVRATPNFGYRSGARLLEKIRQLRSGGGNFRGIEGALMRPTDAQTHWMGRYDEELTTIEAELAALIDSRVMPLDVRLNEAGLGHLIR